MEKFYVNRMAYGIHISTYNTPTITDILLNYKDVLNYSNAMSLIEKGSVFVYLKSTYKELPSNNTDYIHKINSSLDEPILTDREKSAVEQLKLISYPKPQNMIWVQHADIFSL